MENYVSTKLASSRSNLSPTNLSSELQRKYLEKENALFKNKQSRGSRSYIYIEGVFAEIIVLKLLLYWYFILDSFPREREGGIQNFCKTSLLYLKWYQTVDIFMLPLPARSIIWEECKLFYFSQSFSLYFILLFNYTSVVIKTSRRFSTWNIFKSITKYFKIQNKQNIVKYQATF